MKLQFPAIDYHFWLADWGQRIGELPVYSNKNSLKYLRFDGDINECTKQIFELTALENLDKSGILHVVDLIYAWGGPSGRMFYVQAQNGKIPRLELEQNSELFDSYTNGINQARQGSPESRAIFNSLPGIGPSYASQHAYFWSLHSPTPLIVVDSSIAGALGYKTINLLEKDFSYEEVVQAFLDFSKTEFNSAVPHNVERALFAFHNNYFLSNNEGWKNRKPKEDYETAVYLASKLFGE